MRHSLSSRQPSVLGHGRDADTRFIREAERVLRPNGRACIVPLYWIANPESIDPACYVRFALLLRKPVVRGARRAGRSTAAR